MTTRWKTGKEPTKCDVKNEISNALNRPALTSAELEAAAVAVMRLYRDRKSGRR